MNSLVLKFKWLAVVPVIMVMAACSEKPDSASDTKMASKSTDVVVLDVYKNENCGCCKDWISHIETGGFHSVIHHPDDMGVVKSASGIKPEYRSCHTGVSSNGYVFEGHVPVDLMQKFLANPPEDAIGLAVPGMPVGSPGMEMGDRFDPYDVLLLKKDGSSEVYAHKAKAGS